jgi:drug/metabolite transporter (DMT)-like permease
MSPSDRPNRVAGGVVLALAIVYIVWGSTYLAIRFAIETLPAFTMAGLRFLLAGGILYAWARAKGTPRPAARQWRPAALIGLLLLLGGNGGVVWAEHRIPSGVAALLVAVEPVWIALLAPAISGARRAGRRVALGLAAGLVGVTVLVLDPTGGLDPTSIDFLGATAVVLAALSWALGSLVATRADLPRSAALATGMQMLVGGSALLAAGGLAGEWGEIDPSTFSARSLAAFGYLVVAGSIVAFSAYTYLLRNVRPTVVATYAFVNPVVAVLLGWLVAAEPLTWRVAASSALILLAVALIFSDHGERGEAAPAADGELATGGTSATVANTELALATSDPTRI